MPRPGDRSVTSRWQREAAFSFALFRPRGRRSRVRVCVLDFLQARTQNLQKPSLKVGGVVRRPAPAREAFPRPETPSRPPPPSNDATTNASFDARDLWRPAIHEVPADSTNSSLSMSRKTVHSTMRTAGRPHVVRTLTFAVCVADLATRGPTHRVGHFGSRRRRKSAKMGNFSTRRPSRGAISR